MRRISTNMPNDDIQFRLRRHEQALSSIQSKMASQQKIQDLRDDPWLQAMRFVMSPIWLACSVLSRIPNMPRIITKWSMAICGKPRIFISG